MMKGLQKALTPVVILCGGMGTRLREETEIIPKPLVRIGGQPILWHIMKIYSAHGFNRFILPVGYKGEKIKDYFLHYAALAGDFTVDFTDGKRNFVFHTATQERWKVTIVDTGLGAETAARIKRIEPYIEGDMFLLTYGDGVADVDIEKLVKFHEEQGKIATVTGIRPPARFGEIALEGTLAASFWEKPQSYQGHINGGFFALDRKIFSCLGSEEHLSFEKDVLPAIAQQRQLSVFCHNGYWQCMDTRRDVETLQAEWDSGKAPWKIWGT